MRSAFDANNVCRKFRVARPLLCLFGNYVLYHLIRVCKGGLVSIDSRAPLAHERVFFIGVLSAPGNFDRRELFRNKCKPRLSNYRNCEYKFFIGHSAIVKEKHFEKIQGRKPSSTEVAEATRLKKEAEEHDDIILTPCLDSYQDTMDKVVALFRHGVEKNAEFIVKLDDDYCLNTDVVLTWVQSRNAKPEFYVGTCPWKESAYESQKGVNGTFSPYFSGLAYALSNKLADKIFITKYTVAVSSNLYGNSAEDVVVGNLVSVAKADGLDVEYHTLSDMAVPNERI